MLRPNSVSDYCCPSSKDWVATIRKEKRFPCRFGHCFLSKSCKIGILSTVLLSDLGL